MNKEEVIETIRVAIRDLIIARREGKVKDEEYIEQMNAYNEIAKALNS